MLGKFRELLADHLVQQLVLLKLGNGVVFEHILQEGFIDQFNLRRLLQQAELHDQLQTFFKHGVVAFEYITLQEGRCDASGFYHSTNSSNCVTLCFSLERALVHSFQDVDHDLKVCESPRLIHMLVYLEQISDVQQVEQH